MSARVMSTLSAVATIAVIVPSSVSFAEQVVIDNDGLEPSVLFVEPERQVDFVNRTGKLVHVDFLGRDPEQHHVVQLQATNSIWAVFHQSGRHDYEVHFLDPGTKDLKGAVEVGENPYGRPDPLVCGGLTVMGACLER